MVTGQSEGKLNLTHWAPRARVTRGAVVEMLPGGYRLRIPAGSQNEYRLAQIDDYLDLPRKHFAWQAPLVMNLEGRASAPNLPGTWGFGFWNDPFGANLSLGGANFSPGGTTRRLPALPNSAWFFYASPPNALSLYDHLPADGFLAATFRSPQLPPALLALGLPFLPLSGWHAFTRFARRAGRQVIKQSAVRLDLDPSVWHAYSLEWQAPEPDGSGRQEIIFKVDGDVILSTSITPSGRLGFVLWIDNQYAAFRPDGTLAFGRLANPEAFLEVKALTLTHL